MHWPAVAMFNKASKNTGCNATGALANQSIRKYTKDVMCKVEPATKPIC